jgi:hypothetical protein
MEGHYEDAKDDPATQKLAIARKLNISIHKPNSFQNNTLLSPLTRSDVMCLSRSLRYGSAAKFN